MYTKRLSQCRMANAAVLANDSILASKLKNFLDDPVVSDLWRAHCGMASERKPRKKSRKSLSRKSGKIVPASPSCSPSPPPRSRSRSKTESSGRSRTPSRSPSRSSRSKSKSVSRSPSGSSSPSKSPVRGEKSKNSNNRKTQSKSRTGSPGSPTRSPPPKSLSPRSPTRTVRENSRSLSRPVSKRGRSDSSSSSDDDSRPRLKGKQRPSPKYKIPKTKLKVRLPNKGPASLLKESHRILFNNEIETDLPTFDLNKLESNLAQMPCGYFQFGRCSLRNVMAHQDTGGRARVHVHACSLCYRMTKVMFPHNLYECPFATVSKF